MVRDWRKSVDPLIREHLESQIKNTMNYRKAYEDADNKGNAQLWIAVANLSKQLFNTSMKINYIEDLMKDVVKKIDELKEKRDEIAFMEEPKVKKAPTKIVSKKPAKKVMNVVKKIAVKKFVKKSRETTRKPVRKKISRRTSVRKTLKKF